MMTEFERKAHIDKLWSKARRYTNKLRFQAKLQNQMCENLKMVVIDNIGDDVELAELELQAKKKLEAWYIINR